MSEKLIEAIRDLISTLDVTNQLLRAEQDHRREEQEKAAKWSAEQKEALEKLLDQDSDEPTPF